MLQQVSHWNDFSPKLRQKLEDKLKSFGKTVKYKFDIAHIDPSPENKGALLYPQLYTLGPVTFKITDNEEDRKDKSKWKDVGMVKDTDKDGKPSSFHFLTVSKRHKGVIEYNLDVEIDAMMVCYIELHQKLNGGMFEVPTMHRIISRIDEKKDAIEGRKLRNAKAKSLSAATNMKDNEVKDFAAGMTWDENQDIELLRNQVEALAETNPPLFNDLVGSKKLEIQATLKRALDNGIISINPAQHQFLFTSNQQIIASLGESVDDKNEIERFADWISSSTKGDEIYKKIKSLSKS